MCSLPKNFKAVNRRDFGNVHPTVQELGEIVRPQDLPALREEIICAIITALPEPKSTDAVKDMNDALDKIRDSANNTINDAEAEASVISELGKRYEELRGSRA